MFFFPSYPSHIELAWANLISLLLDTYFCPPICPCDDIRWNWHNFLQQIFILFVYFTILKGGKKKFETEGKRAVETSCTTFTTECGSYIMIPSGWLSLAIQSCFMQDKRLLFEMLIQKKKRIFCFVFILIVFLYFPLFSVYLEILF